MKRLAYTLLGALLAAAGGLGALEAQQPARAKLYTQPTSPPRELLDRLNMQMSFRTYVPMDGRRDGFVTVQLHGRQLFVQTRSGLVTLIDAETGAALWRQRVGRAYVAEYALAFNSREVYVVNNVHLYALDRLSGALNWTYRLPEGVATAPVADETMIFVASQTGSLTAYLLPRPDLLATRKKEGREERFKRIASLRTDTGGTSSTVSHLTHSASDASTAEDEGAPRPIRIWSDVTSLRLEFPLLLTHDRLLIPTPTGVLAAFSKAPSPGGHATRSYRFSTESPIRTPAGFFDEVAYVGAEDGNLYAVETKGGRLQWRFTAGVPISRIPVSLGQDVFVVAERQGMTMIDRTTGHPKWRIPTRGQLLESNAAANYFLAANPKYVYALDVSGHFLVLDRRRGVTLSGFDTRDFPYPIANDVTDRVYLVANNGLIVCLHDREYPKAIRHRLREEEAENPLRLRLAELVSIDPMPVMALRDMLALWTKKYPPLQFRIEEDLFRRAERESPAGTNVQMPDVKDKSLGSAIREVLGKINCTYEVAGDILLILPAPVAAPAPAPAPAPK